MSTADTAGVPGVQGVLGWLDAATLGQTQCHEHLSLDITAAFDETYLLNDLTIVGDDLRAAAAAGLHTVVDVGTDDHRRSATFLRDLAGRSGVQVIASTGYWRDGFYPQYLTDESTEQVAEHLIADLTTGIGGTDVRAGVIGEIGSEAGGMSPLAEKAFRASAIAAQATGAAIATHTPEGIDAIFQLDLLCGSGVDPARVLVGHVDCLDDADMHAEIARRGAFVGYDRVGILRYQTDEVRVRLVLEMLERGHRDQLILSTDLATQRRMRVQGQPGYSYLLEVFVPELKKHGVDDHTLWHILVNNPCRLLTGVAATREAGTQEVAG
jgi:phosphotriesterase-related protein